VLWQLLASEHRRKQRFTYPMLIVGFSMQLNGNSGSHADGPT
jgi:hypothetical protein